MHDVTISVNMAPDGNSVYNDTAVVCLLSLLPASCYCGQDGYQLMTSLYMYCSAILINKVDSRSLDAFVLDVDIPVDVVVSSFGSKVPTLVANEYILKICVCVWLRLCVCVWAC